MREMTLILKDPDYLKMTGVKILSINAEDDTVENYPIRNHGKNDFLYK